MKTNKKIVISAMVALFIFVNSTTCHSWWRDNGGLIERWKERRKERKQRNDNGTIVSTITDCENSIPEITEGYGAEGPFDMDIRTIRNPLWKRKEVSVFFPTV